MANNELDAGKVIEVTRVLGFGIIWKNNASLIN